MFGCNLQKLNLAYVRLINFRSKHYTSPYRAPPPQPSLPLFSYTFNGTVQFNIEE